MHLLAFRLDQKLRMSATALVMAAVMTLSACWFKASWIATAEKDLPVLIQMAESIATLVNLIHGGKASAQEIANIQHVSDVATAGLKAIQALYDSYNSANATTTVAQIQAAGAALTQNLESVLNAAQIKNSALAASVAAAVNIIITTVDTFLLLLPNAPASLKGKLGTGKLTVPKPSDLRQMWQSQIGTPLVKLS